MAKKTFRASISIHGSEKKSPRFNKKSDADKWKSDMLRKKQFMRDGLKAPLNEETMLDQYFINIWLPTRKSRYKKPTWGSDEQRYHKYVSPLLGLIKVANINQLQVRNVLRNVVEKYKQSISTRNKVRSLMSKIFNDAMNEEFPLRQDNPAMGISFNDPRVGRKEPKHIKQQKDVLKFMKCAKELGQRHFIYACIQLMSGLRKQEFIPLRWNDFNIDTCELIVDEKFLQAENLIVKGTKAGTEESRVVPIPDELVKTLIKFKSKSEFQADTDFILSKSDGRNMGPRELSKLHDEIRTLSGIDVNPHGLRHTYGRHFVAEGGDMKALQTILGHSNQQTTELYSRLAGRQVSKHRNVVSFNIDEDSDD